VIEHRFTVGFRRSPSSQSGGEPRALQTLRAVHAVVPTQLYRLSTGFTRFCLDASVRREAFLDEPVQGRQVEVREVLRRQVPDSEKNRDRCAELSLSSDFRTPNQLPAPQARLARPALRQPAPDSPAYLQAGPLGCPAH